MPVDYTANWKKVDTEVGRVRGREGGRAGIHIGREGVIGGRERGRGIKREREGRKEVCG